MSNVQQNVDPPITPSPAPHNDAAQLLIDQLRAMREQIPNFSFPASPKVGPALIRAASVPQPFVELTAVAVKNSPALVRGGGADPVRLRDLMTFAVAYAPFADELEALASFVRHSVTAAKNEAGSTALTTYALAQRLAKRPETADLAPHVHDMKRALTAGGTFGGRKGKGKPSPNPAPGPAPAPVPAGGASPAEPPPVTTAPSAPK
jgi:hypothetical protein